VIRRVDTGTLVIVGTMLLLTVCLFVALAMVCEWNAMQVG